MDARRFKFKGVEFKNYRADRSEYWVHECKPGISPKQPGNHGKKHRAKCRSGMPGKKCRMQDAG